jgi:hypothetical protein
MYNRRTLQQKTFLILLVLASIAFALVLLPLWVPVSGAEAVPGCACSQGTRCIICRRIGTAIMASTPP